MKHPLLSLGLFVSLLFLLPACRTFSADKLPAERLHFGNKGGVTGEFREYVLFLKSGRLLFHDPLTDNYYKVGKFSKERLEEVRATVEKLNFTAAQIPGNKNAVLIYHLNENRQELQWQSPRGAPDAKTQLFYEDLMKTVKEIRLNE